MALVTLAHAVITGLAGKSAGELAPRRVSKDAVVHAAPICRVRVLPVKSSNADFHLWHEFRVNELGNIRNALHPVGGMSERYQAVGLAAAITGIEAEDACGGTGIAGEASKDVVKKIL